MFAWRAEAQQKDAFAFAAARRYIVHACIHTSQLSICNHDRHVARLFLPPPTCNLFTGLRLTFTR